MDGFIIALCSLSCVLSLICICLCLRMIMLQKNRGDDETERLIGELREDMLSENSRNRTEQNALLGQQRDEMARSIEKISNSVDKLTETNYTQIRSINRDISEQLTKIDTRSRADSERQTEKISQSLELIRKSNDEKLEQMRKTVDEKLNETLSQRLDSSFKTVSDQLEKLYSALGEMKEMSGGIASLNGILKNVKSRGTWAELQLKGILDETIPNMYVENYSPNPGALERVEFAVKIPASDGSGGITYLPLDSKFPMEAYIRLSDAAERADADAVAVARKELEDEVLKEAKAITKYISVPRTTPFAIMYLASEGLYAEIVSSRSGLLEKIQHDYNILISGPMTITALLTSLAMGFRIAAINEKANEVRALLGAVKSQYVKFGDLLDKAKKKVDEASSSLEDAQKRNRLIQKKLKGVEEIDVSESDGLLGIGEQTDVADSEYTN